MTDDMVQQIRDALQVPDCRLIVSYEEHDAYKAEKKAEKEAKKKAEKDAAEAAKKAKEDATAAKPTQQAAQTTQ